MPRATRKNPRQTLADVAGKYNFSGIPTAAGGRSKPYDKARALYNYKGSNSFEIRAALANALAGVSLATALFCGDSKTAGFGTNAAVSINAARSMPGWFRQLMQGRGYPIAGTGLVFCNQNPGQGTGDTRWTFSAGWTVTGNDKHWAQANSAGRTATFVSEVPGTVVEVYALSNNAGFQYSIDGGAAVNVTPSGTDALHVTTVTGLADTVHTVVVTTTASTATYLVGACVRRATGLQVTNAGISGSVTDGLTATQWYLAGGISQRVPATFAFFSLDTNDARAPIAAATYRTKYQALIQTHISLGRQCVMILQSPVATNQVSSALWDQYVAAQYDIADALDIPLIDLTDIYGTWAAANAKGLFFDELHEKEAGYGVNAGAVVSALGV